MISKVTIEEIAVGGDGVGRLDDGMVVFVPRSAPGDQLEVQITHRKQRYARGRVSAVLSPSPDRVEPRCTHYDADECGGCQLQHLSASAQREARRKIVGDALRRYLDERGAPQGAGVVAASWGSIPADPELLRVVLEDEDGLLDG